MNCKHINSGQVLTPGATTSHFGNTLFQSSSIGFCQTQDNLKKQENRPPAELTSACAVLLLGGLGTELRQAGRCSHQLHLSQRC